MRRLAIRVAAPVLGLAALAALLTSGTAGAQGSSCPDGCVDVIEVDGWLDPILVDFIESAIDRAEASGDVVNLVLQLDSPGAAVGDERFEELASAVAGSDVPVSVWIGPSGAEARGAAAELVQVADSASIAAGSEIGDVGRQRLPEEAFGDLFGDAVPTASDRTVGWEEAVELGLVDRQAAIVGDHIIELDGVETRVVEEGDEQRREPVTTTRFRQLPLLSQLMHTVASPPVAYLLLAIGLGLLIFELFTAGIGVAGVTGAGCLVLAAYGIAALPHTGWGLALIGLATFGFAVDVQAGVPRAWSAIATVSFTAGSILLFPGDLRPWWLTLAVGIGGMVAAMVSGMPAMVRTRFGTPTIGREWMVGELGEALTDVDPEGTVSVRCATWPARTNRATPIAAQHRVRVVSIEGPVLEVEPEEGGARDYRERARGRERDGS